MSIVIKEVTYKPSEISRLSTEILSATTRPTWVAGGAARRMFLDQPLWQSDIDVFFSSNETVDVSAVTTHLIALGFHMRHTSQRAFTMRRDALTVQVCSNALEAGSPGYPDLTALFGTFDFTVAMFAFDGERLFATEEALDDIKARRLRVPNRDVKTPSVSRLLKYLDEGFTPAPADLPWLFDLDRCEDREPSDRNASPIARTDGEHY